MKTVALKELAKYANQYVALSEDRSKILASAKTIEALNKKIEKLDVKETILHYVPQLDSSLSL
jgi:hypothetical protein